MRRWPPDRAWPTRSLSRFWRLVRDAAARSPVLLLLLVTLLLRLFPALLKLFEDMLHAGPFLAPPSAGVVGAAGGGKLADQALYREALDGGPTEASAVVYVNLERVLESSVADLSAEDRAVLGASQRPIVASAFGEPSGTPGWPRHVTINNCGKRNNDGKMAKK